jgi:hypothetical protein
MFVSGVYRRCFHCSSQMRDRRAEYYFRADHVIAGEQVCRACGTKHLYTRHPSTWEREHEQPRARPRQRKRARRAARQAQRH